MTPGTPDPSPAEGPRGAAHFLDLLATIGCAALAVITAGFAAFRFLPAALPPGASRNPDRTFFEAVNAFTLTGFATTNVLAFPPLGRAIIAMLAVGGAILSLAGAASFLSVALALPVRRRTLAAWTAGALAVPFLAACAFGPFDAMSAATGLGLTSTRSFGLAARLCWAAASVPGLLGAFGLLALFAGLRDRRGYLAASLAALASLYAAGTLVLWVVVGASTDPRSLALASAQSLDLRGLGLSGGGLPTSTAWPWATMLLALPGGGAASTAGGLGVLPLVIVGRGCVDALRGRAVDRLVAVAVAWVVAFLATIALTVLCLAAVEPSVGGERLLLLCVGSVANVGLTQDPVGITGPGLFLLSAAMLVGRLLPMGMLCWAAILSAAPATLPVAPVAKGRKA